MILSIWIRHETKSRCVKWGWKASSKTWRGWHGRSFRCSSSDYFSACGTERQWDEVPFITRSDRDPGGGSGDEWTTEWLEHGIILTHRIESNFFIELDHAMSNVTMLRSIKWCILATKVVYPTSSPVKIIGFEVCGDDGTISLEAEAIFDLISSTLLVLTRATVSGTMLSHIIGRWTWWQSEPIWSGSFLEVVADIITNTNHRINITNTEVFYVHRHSRVTTHGHQTTPSDETPHHTQHNNTGLTHRSDLDTDAHHHTNIKRKHVGCQATQQ